MSGHFSSASQSHSSWHLAAFAIAGCAAGASLMVAANPAQLWAPANVGVTSVQTVGTAVVPRHLAMRASQQNLVQPASDFVAESASSTNPSVKAATFAGAGFVLAGAALAAARRLLAPKEESVALLVASSEKEDKERMLRMVETLDSADMRLISRGASMQDVAQSKGIEEVALAIRADQASRKDLTPRDVILEMQRGNGRFWMGLSERPDMNAMQRRALIMAQAPKICVLSCSDSRVPVEIIFDQGLGDIFVVRMAGNILDANAHGSIEFAVKYLGVKVVLVIGHEGCGAVKGAITMSQEDLAKEPFDLQVVLTSIKSNLDVNELKLITDSRAREREAIVQNTSNQVKRLQQNQLIAQQVAEGKLMVAGAFYEISSGIVDFFSLDKNGFVVDI